MLGDVAARLLKMMGHSGAIPSAIAADDVPAALERLQRAIKTEVDTVSAQAAETDGDDARQEAPVRIDVRAFPLIELLKSAVQQDCSVMWYAE